MRFAGRSRTEAETQLDRSSGPTARTFLPHHQFPSCCTPTNWVLKDVENNAAGCFEVGKTELQQFLPFSSLRRNRVYQSSDSEGVVDSLMHGPSRRTPQLMSSGLVLGERQISPD